MRTKEELNAIPVELNDKDIEKVVGGNDDIWLEEKSTDGYGQDNWCELDNSGTTFIPGSRFWTDMVSLPQEEDDHFLSPTIEKPQ